MQSIHLKQQEAAEPLDDATKAAVELGRAAIRRGETITWEQSKTNARERHKAWKNNLQPTTLPA